MSSISTREIWWDVCSVRISKEPFLKCQDPLSTPNACTPSFNPISLSSPFFSLFFPFFFFFEPGTCVFRFRHHPEEHKIRDRTGTFSGESGDPRSKQ